MFEWGISSIVFGEGEVVNVDKSSTLIIIGPNSSGKSTALRQIQERLKGQSTVPHTNPIVVKSVSKYRSGTIEEFMDWLRQNYPSTELGGSKGFITKGGALSESSIQQVWQWMNQSNDPMGAVAFAAPGFDFLCHRLDTDSRLRLGNNTSSRSLYFPPGTSPSTAHPTEYIHVLQADENLMHSISDEVNKAFSVELVINWAGAGAVWFHVGKEPRRSAENDRVSAKYQEELHELPRLDDEGDGIRSFVGTLLAVKCGAHPVLLIDEPEAFLHPPQIRRLAGILATSAETQHRQIIIATHSSEVIRGALAASKNVSICRLTRDGNTNSVVLLNKDDIAKLWSNPLLRSVSAFDGVFHQGVVVCEGDADSRFYEAIGHRLESEQKVSTPLDLYFVHGGGKGELATIAEAYQKLKVPIAVIADLDLLRNKAEFKKLLL
ncbi:MAG: AAA family ATPase, partial [Abitibacteriaceae bacterium]|nr:AAA family ATPase [Abditibacteriaceae bacterium]